MGESTGSKSTKASANDVTADQETVNGAGPMQDELNTAAAAATKAREAADEAKADADAELVAAQSDLAAVDAKLEFGDDFVTPEAYTAAQFRVKQAQGIAARRERELTEARQAEQVAVAIAAAATVVDGQASRAALDAAAADAQKAVTRAVQKVIDVAKARNAALAQAMAEARSAGLVAGQADPFSPVLIGSKPHRLSWQRPVPVLLVNGEPAEEVPPVDVVTAALSRAVRSTGLDIDVAKAGGGR